MTQVADREAILLDPHIQNLIGVVMNENGLLEGIGPLSGDDVRQHLQETAWRACQRWDASLGIKPITLLWRRLFGEAKSLIRKYGTRKASGELRVQEIPIELAAFPSADGIDALTEELSVTEAIQQLPAQYRMVLYHRYYMNQNTADTAASMGITTGMVCQYEHAAIVQMRLLLTPPC